MEEALYFVILFLCDYNSYMLIIPTIHYYANTVTATVDPTYKGHHMLYVDRTTSVIEDSQ